MGNEVEIHVEAKDNASRVLSGVGKAFSAIRDRALGAVKGLASLGLGVASVAQAGLAVTPAIIAAVKAVYSVGQAAVQAAPALVAFAVAGKFVSLTLKQIFAEGSAMMKVLEPIKKRFEDAGKAASEAAASGLEPLISKFNALNMPNVEATMVRIGDAVNKVSKGFFTWANSAEGVQSIRSALIPIGEAMNDLAPHITNVTISFVKMLGRIMGVSMEAGENGLAGALDKVASVMDKIDAKSVGGGLEKLGETMSTLKRVGSTVKDVIGRIVDLYTMYQEKFGAVADAVSIVAIAFGGPVTAIAGAAGLIIRHFDDIKKAYASFQEYFRKPIGKGVLSDLTEAARTVLPGLKSAFEDVKSRVVPAVKDIADVVSNKLLPAFADFSKEISPAVREIIKFAAPFVGDALRGSLEMIAGLLEGLAGTLKMLSGVISGDWSKAIEGANDQLAGLGKFLRGAVRAIAPGLWEKGADAIKEVRGKVSDLIGTIKGLHGKVVKIAQSGGERAREHVLDLIGTIRRLAGKVVKIGENGARAAWRAVSDLIGIIRRLAGKVVKVGANVFGVGAIQNLIGWIGRVVGKIVDVGANIHIPGFAHGGIIGAAGGGPRSNLVMVGEQGRELVRLPFGSTVMPNGQTEAMLSGASGGSAGLRPILIKLMIGDRELGELLLDPIRGTVQAHGGNVQAVFGRT